MSHRNKRPTTNDRITAAKPAAERPSMTAWITADLYDDESDQPDAAETDTEPSAPKKAPKH